MHDAESMGSDEDWIQAFHASACTLNSLQVVNLNIGQISYRLQMNFLCQNRDIFDGHDQAGRITPWKNPRPISVKWEIARPFKGSYGGPKLRDTPEAIAMLRRVTKQMKQLAPNATITLPDLQCCKEEDQMRLGALLRAADLLGKD